VGGPAGFVSRMNVFTHYQGLLDVFTKCGKDSGFQIPSPVLSLKKLNPPDAIWSELGIVGGMLSLKTDIADGSPNGFAEDWGLPLGELEILISPLEQIRIDDPWNIKRSQIEIAYLFFNLDTGKTELLLALHFDFGVKKDIDEPHDAHPLFHVSLTHKLFQLGAALQQRNVEVKRMEGVPGVRLPTAHMTLPSVLLNVAADHFQPQEFTKFLRHMRAAGEYPTMVNSFFKKRMEKHKTRMRSCAWYADLPAVAAC